ncbi:hypothetical protein CEXT_434381, partial [Caerostris extrusa]
RVKEFRSLGGNSTQKARNLMRGIDCSDREKSIWKEALVFLVKVAFWEAISLQRKRRVKKAQHEILAVPD